MVPFCLFNLESSFEDCEEGNEEAVGKLRETCHHIAARLKEVYEAGLINAAEVRALYDMMKNVTAALTGKYERVRKEVQTIMGGKVLDYPTKDILNRGRAEGKLEGLAEGKLTALNDLVHKGLISLSDAAEAAGMTVEAFQEKVRALS